MVACGCAGCEGYDRVFSAKMAKRELRVYREDGPRETTRMLVEWLGASPLAGWSLLDVGGGVGALQHELVARGVAKVTHVDGSPHYLRAAREEAEARGYADRRTEVGGDFVQVAPSLDAADVVTLDRVVCCYPDADALLDASAGRATRFVGLVLPRDAWWTRIGLRFGNVFMALRRNPYRAFIHPPARVAARLAQRGFRQVRAHQGGWWRVELYERNA